MGPAGFGVPGAPVPVGSSGAAQHGPITPAVLDTFWDTPVSRAILDRLAGIERRLDGSAASAQNDMSSLELFQAEVLHRLDATEQRSAVAPGSSVMAVNEDSRPVQMEVEVADRRGVAQQECAGIHRVTNVVLGSVARAWGGQYASLVYFFGHRSGSAGD
ncbi:UNVERIFIED_CONTAM: hypothetical protein K2H54_057598 [Gekko kuhli]